MRQHSYILSGLFSKCALLKTPLPIIGFLFFIIGCATTPDIETFYPIVTLKYPVILVHGIAFNDREDVTKSWGNIPSTLQKCGVRIFLGNTDGWGSYRTNAAILKETIENVFTETGSEKVNIIAHSKGGIDARYLIWRYDLSEKVASLTTIATPHKGSEVADAIQNGKLIHSQFAKHLVKAYEASYGDKNPTMYDVLFELTTERMQEFNAMVPPDVNVYCQSISVMMKKPSDDPVLAATNRYIKKLSGDNDGLVSVESATWGQRSQLIEGSVSHREIVNQREVKGIDILLIYINIVQGLSDIGF
jgi:hypothetical protein